MNTWRREYELLGGFVENGETFFEAARRELDEETGIRVDTLHLLGYARFVLTDPSREELGAVYFARVTNQRATVSHEMPQFTWRAPLSKPDLAISTLDDAIAGCVVRSLEVAE